jgi:D-arabinose 1-dehydrogenase-like Zn-dependent alcohol dehydrogenase
MTRVDGWRLHAWGPDLRWESFEVGRPAPGEVLVEVEACGVGLTVMNCMNGDLDDSARLLPLTPGHEVVGKVVDTGDAVEEPRPGDRVMAYFYLSCMSCMQCVSGRESRCERLAGWYGVHRDGGYAPLTSLPAANALPLPAGLSGPEATVIPDAVATPVHVCMTRLSLRPGDRVAVVGAGGGVGIHMVQVAAACGATVTGLEQSEDKLALVSKVGAEPLSATEMASGSSALGGPVDAVIDLVGTPETLRWGWDVLTIGGRLCVLTTFRGIELAIDPRDFVFKECSIVGSRYASRSELMQAAELIASKAVRPIVGATVAAGDVTELHAELRAGTLHGRGALVW